MELNEAEINQQNSNVPKQGMLLPPGYKPEDSVYSQWQLSSLRNKFNPPLSDAELECWKEHRFLQCPISQQTILDKEAGIGIGIYQMPYALPESEKQRQSDNDKKFRDKRAQEEAFAKAAGVEVAPTSSVDDMFQVYPIVAAPPENSLKNDFFVKLYEQGEQAHLGRLKVCIGLYCSKKAYNWGITGSNGQLFDLEKPLIWPMQKRGIVNLFQQYNACVFRWAMVKPEGDGKYSRKNFNITNRLALYATADHGQDVLKGLIESQISLLLYNQSNIFKGTRTMPGRPELLPSATRKVFPRILKAVVEEVLSDRNQGIILDEEYLDHVIRTYCWVHQVTIKFVKHHRHVYEHIYRAIMRWVQNPFLPENRRTWPQIEELLVACSLVNIPWAVIREAFVRRLFAEMAELASDMKDEADMHKRMRHMFHQNLKRIQSILMVMSFHMSKPLGELDRQYERCGGLLPKTERDKIKASIAEIKKVTCLEEFWCTLGMDNPALPKKELHRHLEAFFDYIVANNGSWSTQAVDPRVLNAIQVPEIQEPEEIRSVQGDGGILSYRQREAELRKKRRQELHSKHQGMPILPKHGVLSANKCNYHHCGQEFNNRSQLFEHLREAIPEFYESYHISHQDKDQAGCFPYPDDLKAEFDRAEADGVEHHWQCPACRDQFTDFESIRKHLRDVGVKNYFEPGDQLDELMAQEEAERIAREDQAEADRAGASMAGAGASDGGQVADPYGDLDNCVVCLDQARAVIFIRCGHLIACAGCGQQLRSCPICRAPIQQRLPVAYRDQTDVRVFQV